MLDIEQQPSVKYFVFGLLYVSEGLMIALTTVVTSLYLRSKGVSIPLTTLIVGIANIPWILKFTWGPIVDYFTNYGRKTFIVTGSILSILALFGITMIDPGVYLVPFTILLFLSHVGIGFIDVSTDAWAIDISTKKNRGKINGAMYTGQYGAWAVGAALLPFIGFQYGYQFSYLTTGLIILFILLFLFLIKETFHKKNKPRIGSLIKYEFTKKTVLLIALFSPLIFVNEGMLSYIMPIYMRDSLQLTDIQIGLISMILPLFLAIGSVSGGITTDKIGRKKALYLFIGFNILFTALLIFTDNWWKLSVIYGIIGFLMGAHSTISCALFMDVTNPKIAATQYGIFTGIANIGLNGGGMITGTLVVAFGFPGTFLYAAWVFGPALLLLYFIQPKEKKKIT